MNKNNLSELQKEDFKTVGVSRKDGKTKTYKTKGFGFFYKYKKWYLYRQEKMWKIINPETGYLVCENFYQAGAMLEFVNYINETSFNQQSAMIGIRKEELKKAGIKLPVNK